MAERASFAYDVFLSFRGKDTRLGFTGYLYSALSQRGIHTFFDDPEIRKGEELTPALLKAIKESRIAITVLSKNYASSSFCLKELAEILECFKEKKDRLVLPVFYGVDPCDVRHERGSYGEALAKHEERFKDDKEKVNRWRMALHQAANLSGFPFKLGDGYECEFVGSIVKEVSRKINSTLLHVADYPVGLESRVGKVKSLLNVKSNHGVHMVGICGIGGIGKSTIARAVYNSISDHFEGFCCFLEDVRENSRKYGLVHLQEKVLSEILGEKDIKLGGMWNGMAVIQHRLQSKKVLLVLDDVDKKEQLQAIVGARQWFGIGSTIIITTRDSGLLDIHEDVRKYEVEELKDEEARDLLSWYAFKTNKDDPKYIKMLNRAVGYASRLPLALKIIGSHLSGNKDEEECKLILDWYDSIPDGEIQAVLRVSYDSLEGNEKQVFLDIACCFGGYKLSDVENILHAHHGFSVRLSIEQLIKKSLIKVDNGLVTLHNLIQDMGREIVRQESKEPGERSRLWICEDVVRILEEKKGTSKIDILILDFPKDEVHSKGPNGEEVQWDGEAFKQMKNLKTLIIRNAHFSQGPTHLPNSLRVLKWWGYPSPSLPGDFYPNKLSILELPDSCLKSFKPIQEFTYLTVLDLSYCEHIAEIPDVSCVPKLEKLSFKHCDKLTKIDVSVGHLGNLEILDASSCKNLETFPSIRLTSLKQLNLSHCSNLKSFPEILGKMENITELHVVGSPIKELPSSIQNLTRLQKLELQFCGIVQLPSSIVMMPKLGMMHVSRCEGLQLSKQGRADEMESSNTECLILSYCDISDEFLPIDTWFANVKDLNLSGNNFTTLPACIKNCHLLRILKLDDCRLLREIRGIPRKLEIFSAKGCTALKSLDLKALPACSEECHDLKELILDDSWHLREIPGLTPNLDHFFAKNCTYLTPEHKSMLVNQEMVEAGNKMFVLPGTKIPDWFTHRTSRGWSMSFWFRNKFPVISLCLVIGLMNEQPITVKFSPRIFINGKKQSLASGKVCKFNIRTDHIFLFEIQLLNFEDDVDSESDTEWKRVEVLYADHITDNEVPIRRVAKHGGIHVLKQTSSMKDIQFIDSNVPNKRKTKSCQESPYTQNQLHVEHSKEQFLLHPAQATENVNCDPDSMEGPSQTVSRKRPGKDQNMPREDAGGQTSERLPKDEDFIEDSNTEGSHSDDLFHQVNGKYPVSGKETISCGANFGDASLIPIRKAISDLELLMVNKDLSEVSSDPATRCQLHNLLDTLSTSSHPKVTVEVKKAIVKFKINFAAIKSVNMLKNSEAERKEELEAEIETLKKQLTAKERDLQRLVLNLKNQDAKLSTCSTNCASLKEKTRKLLKEVDDILATLSGTKDMGEAIEVMQNRLQDQEATLVSPYSTSCALNERARARSLLKQADDLLATSNGNGIEHDGEADEEEQNELKWTWPTDLSYQLNKIKSSILG